MTSYLCFSAAACYFCYTRCTGAIHTTYKLLCGVVGRGRVVSSVYTALLLLEQVPAAAVDMVERERLDSRPAVNQTPITPTTAFRALQLHNICRLWLDKVLSLLWAGPSLKGL